MEKKNVFTTPCFIYKNTNGLREKLYRLGERSGNNLWDIDINTLLAADKKSFRCYDNEYGIAELLIRDNYIDCGTNEDLFLAIAALRDDSDIYQWFTDGKKWVISDVHTLIELKEYFEKIKFDYSKTHKATVEELIKHFNS